MDRSKYEVIVASDVSNRDGIGIEVWENNELVAEIFRDDSSKTRTVQIFKETVSLDFIEDCIKTFKNEIPWDFLSSD